MSFKADAVLEESEEQKLENKKNQAVTDAVRDHGFKNWGGGRAEFYRNLVSYKTYKGLVFAIVKETVNISSVTTDYSTDLEVLSPDLKKVFSERRPPYFGERSDVNTRDPEKRFVEIKEINDETVIVKDGNGSEITIKLPKDLFKNKE